jgi:hypothetical protein
LRRKVARARERARWHVTLDNIDPRTGLVRDHGRIRVPMPTMDAAPPRRSNVPLVLSSKGYIPEEIRRHMYDGIPGITRTSDAPRRRKAQERDRFGRESGSFEEEDAVTHDAYSANRPGYRGVADAAGATVNDAARLAYDAYVADLTSAWKSQEVRDAERALSTWPMPVPLASIHGHFSTSKAFVSCVTPGNRPRLHSTHGL